MPAGAKNKYTSKQKRKAEHIEESYEKRGVNKKQAEERAWRTVNKQDGGGKIGGSAKKKSGKSKARSSGSARKKSAGRKRNKTAKKR